MGPKTKRRKQTETHSSDIAGSQPLSLKRLCKDCHWNVVRKTLQEQRFIDAISKAGRGFCNLLPATIITVTDYQTIEKATSDIEALGRIRDALGRSLEPCLLKELIRVLRHKKIGKMQHAEIIEQCFHDEIRKHKCCRKCLTEGEDQTQGQCPDVDKDTMQDVQDYLIRKYKKDELSITKPIPGEEFRVRLDEKNMMRPKFTAEEIDFENRKNKDYIASFGKLETNQTIYKNIDTRELQMMFKSVCKIDKKIGNVQENLICLVGDPGVGKTTVAQWFTLGWAKGEGWAKRYKLVFFIPIRFIGHETLLRDILFRLKLLPTEQFDWFRAVQNNADAVLFLLDGVDEFDIPDDVDKLIKGEIFSDSTVAITARPEAKYFMSLSLLPRVKVSLSGTDEDTVARYLRAAVSPPSDEPPSDEEWTNFQDMYKEKLHDESLLCVPLYLTLLCTVFREHIVSGIKCANLKVPESATQLFNIFLKVLLDRWHARSCPDYKKLDISFERSPLASESKVPFHMKTFLFFIGRLCFYDLSNSDSHYQFTDKEIRDYLLDSQIIKDSGFFNIGKSGDDEIFFLKHKQLQEYLAAVYLSFQGTNDFRFNVIMYSEENKGKSLALVMRDYGLIKVVEFTCGLSGKFLTDLLQALPSQSSVMQSCFEQIDIYYEAALFIEQNAGNLSAMVGFNELMNHLECSIINTVRDKEFNFLLGETTKTAQGFYQKCLRKLTSLIDINMSTNILSRFYKLIISFPNQAHEQLTEPVFKVTLCLDQLQTELLSMFRLKDVKSVESVTCNTDNFPPCYVNLPALLETFPDLESLDVSGTPYIPYSSDKRSRWEMGSSVKSVDIWNYSSPIILPDSHVTSLLKQRTLTKLTLGKVSPLTTLEVVREAGQSPWPVLKDFTLTGDLETLSEAPVDTLTHLVKQHSDTLEIFWLSLDNVKISSVPQIEMALQSLRRVHRLYLNITLSSSASSSVTVEVVKNVIPHLTSLETLEVMHIEDSLLLPELVEAVYSHRGIQTLIFSLWSDEPDAQFPEDLKRKLHERQVKIFWERGLNLTEIM